MPIDARSRVEDLRVPAEHRLLGLDKRSFPYALFVVGVFILATVVIPRIDKAIDWDDPVRAGDQLALPAGIVLTPAVGWQVESGQRVADDPEVGKTAQIVLVDDGVTFAVSADAFDGTPAELIDQVDKVTSGTSDPSFEVSGDPSTVTTTAGNVGVIQGYSSVRGDGVVAAFVIDGTGLKITAYGPPAELADANEEIDAMIASIGVPDGRP
ncbi:hypothetical protein ASC77_10260 [Nocardioides sp. Root1257]|uniref:hypothetical protein n=1 Tax=unclassified Nocardioides TaxID=2615069 RepID=UPI0006FD2389|nr:MULTISPECIES: hypothetical protein [unclassified Nocardioides]KQW49078.1 hypothetical protein ASC77_10260 [Nocardioides sp. Root1257]KRC48252.1 hypothetical protein ASE24_10265 [Nocardioides sp. Root224]